MSLSRVKRSAAVASLIAYCSACTSWHAVTEPPERAIARGHPSAVRVTTAERRQVIESPQIRGDSLAGTLQRGVPTSVALGDVEGLEVRKISTWKTIGLVYLSLNVVGLVVLLASGTDLVPDFGDGG